MVQLCARYNLKVVRSLIKEENFLEDCSVLNEDLIKMYIILCGIIVLNGCIGRNVKNSILTEEKLYCIKYEKIIEI